MRAGDRAVDLLTADIGVAEHPPGSNRTKYGSYWGNDGEPYCAMAVSWAYAEAGAPLPSIQTSPAGRDGYWAYVPYGWDWARRHGEFTDEPRRGDIVLYGDGVDQTHTGLFEAWTAPGEFTAIEANTASDNDTDGIFVARRLRSTWWVAGFWHPAAADIELPGGPPDYVEDFEMKVCRTNGGRIVVVEGSTFRVVPEALEWEVLNAAVMEAAAAGVVPPDAPSLPVLGDNALSPAVGLLREVPWT